MVSKKELIKKIQEKYETKELITKLDLKSRTSVKKLTQELMKLKINELEELLKPQKKLEISLKPDKWLIPAIGLSALIITLIVINNLPAVTSSTDEVIITYLTDASCELCFDMTINSEILSTQYGVNTTAVTYDINSLEGKELISKYAITKIPTFILSKEAANKSTTLSSVWSSVGTIESDGSLIFRAPELFSNNYKIMVEDEFVMYIPPETTLGYFILTEEETVCLDNGKPAVYFFGSTTCPHCAWEEPIIDNVTALFNETISYHKIKGTSDYQTVFMNYYDIHNGGVPFIVIGCQYVRVGSGESVTYDANKTINPLNITHPELITDISNLINQSEDYYMQAQIAYYNNESYEELSDLAYELYDEANIKLETQVLKSLICNITSNQPASVCE